MFPTQAGVEATKFSPFIHQIEKNLVRIRNNYDQRRYLTQIN